MPLITYVDSTRFNSTNLAILFYPILTQYNWIDLSEADKMIWIDRFQRLLDVMYNCEIIK